MPRRGGRRGVQVEATQDAVGVAGRAYGMDNPKKIHPCAGVSLVVACPISHFVVLGLVGLTRVDITGVGCITHSVIASIRTLVGETSIGETFGDIKHPGHTDHRRM